MTDVALLHRRACEAFADAVAGVQPDQWTDPTPCAAWTVRDLVSHVVGEDLWTVPLIRGATMEEVGDRFDGDVLGEDPVATAETAAKEAAMAVSEPGALERTVHLSFGDTDGADYAWQLFADHLIHTWDLVRATGQPDRLDPELVDACAVWFADQEATYRGAGVIGPRATVADDADAQARLLASAGRSADWAAPRG